MTVDFDELWDKQKRSRDARQLDLERESYLAVQRAHFRNLMRYIPDEEWADYCDAVRKNWGDRKAITSALWTKATRAMRGE